MPEAPATRPKISQRKRGRPSCESSEEIRTRIVDVALCQFILSGFEGASIARMAREAGVSRQLIHQRFGSKEQLFAAVMAEREARFSAVTELPEDVGQGSFYETLTQYAESFVTYLLQPWRIELTRLTVGGIYRHPEMARIQYRGQQRAECRLVAYIERVLAAQGIVEADSQGAAEDFRMMVIGLTLPVVMGMIEQPSPEARRLRIGALVRRFMRGLGVEPPA